METIKRYRLSELEKQAIALGADYYRHYFVPVSYYTNPSRKEVWATHFFNKDHKEVAMLINSAQLYELCGLKVFETPRVWAEKFFNSEMMGKPIYLDK
jgi:hypothetical protein